MKINRQIGIAKEGIVVKVTENLIVLMTEEGRFKNVKRKPDQFPLIGEKLAFTEVAKDKPSSSWMKFIAYAAVFLLMVIGYSQYPGQAVEENFLVAVDINPSLEIYLDTDYKVLRVEGLNGDGQGIVDHLSLDNKHIEDILKDIVALSMERGYLKSHEESVILSSVVDLQTGDKDISKDIEKTFEEILKEENLPGDVVVEKEEKEAVSEAHEKKVSVNRYKLYKKLNQGEPPADIEKLNKTPVKVLLEEVKKKQEKDASKNRNANKDLDTDMDEERDLKGKDRDNNPSGDKKDRSKATGNPGLGEKDKTAPKDKGVENKGQGRKQDKDQKDKKDSKDEKEGRKDSDKGTTRGNPKDLENETQREKREEDLDSEEINDPEKINAPEERNEGPRDQELSEEGQDPVENGQDEDSKIRGSIVE